MYNLFSNNLVFFVMFYFKVICFLFDIYLMVEFRVFGKIMMERKKMF